jgi:hypothetical protein
MAVKEQLIADLEAALRQGDALRRDVLRFTLSALRYAEIAAGGELDDAGALAVLTKEAKQRRESIDAFRKGGRQDLVDKEEAELAVLSVYLPEQLSRDEIADAARAVIDETGASGAKDIGRVMPALMERLRGRADGRAVSEVVRELLSGG